MLKQVYTIKKKMAQIPVNLYKFEPFSSELLQPLIWIKFQCSNNNNCCPEILSYKV